MISLEKLRIIAKAKLADKSKLGNWYQKRLEICKECPYNSDNKNNKSLRDVGVVTMNLGARACLACTCGIDAKAAVRSEECGLVKIGKTPLWGKLPEIERYNIKNLKVESLNKDLVTISPGAITIMDYGEINSSTDTSFEISLEGAKDDISNLRVSTSCGCTTTTKRQVGAKFYVTLKYTSSNLGPFSKTVIFHFTQKGLPQVVTAKLIGKLNK